MFSKNGVVPKYTAVWTILYGPYYGSSSVSKNTVYRVSVSNSQIIQRIRIQRIRRDTQVIKMVPKLRNIL